MRNLGINKMLAIAAAACVGVALSVKQQAQAALGDIAAESAKMVPGGYRHTYAQKSQRTVAQDKRDARKARNRRRSR